MKKLYAFGLSILASTFSFGQAFTATYDFASVTSTSGLTDPTLVPTATGMTFGSFTAVNPISTNPNSGGRFSFINQPTGATDGAAFSALTGSPDAGTYFQVTLTPNSGIAYNLDNITFTSQRSGSGVRTYVVRSSVDGYVSNLPASINPANAELSVQPTNVFFRVNDPTTTAQVGSTITLSGSSFVGRTTPVTFRFYGYNAEGTGGTFSIDDVVISGAAGVPASVSKNEIAGLSIYPNPAKDGKLFITSDSNENKAVVIYDLLGKQVLRANVSSEVINIASLTSGAYFVKVIENNKTATRKLLVQ